MAKATKKSKMGRSAGAGEKKMNRRGMMAGAGDAAGMGRRRGIGAAAGLPGASGPNTNAFGGRGAGMIGRGKGGSRGMAGQGGKGGASAAAQRGMRGMGQAFGPAQLGAAIQRADMGGMERRKGGGYLKKNIDGKATKGKTKGRNC